MQNAAGFFFFGAYFYNQPYKRRSYYAASVFVFLSNRSLVCKSVTSWTRIQQVDIATMKRLSSIKRAFRSVYFWKAAVLRSETVKS